MIRIENISEIGCTGLRHLRTVTLIPLLIVVSLSQQSCRSDSRSIQKGEASLRLGDNVMAVRFFEEVLRHDPENFNARLGMGKALIQQASGRNADSTLWSRALTHLEAARTLNPGARIEPLLCEAWIVSARRLLEKNDTVNGLNALVRAIGLDPRGIEALNLAGIVYFRMGEPVKAGMLFDRALAADTARPFTLFNVGMVRWASGDVRGAHTAWFRALREAPQDKDIVYWYSVAEKRIRESNQ